MLLEAGADVNARDKAGDTPLHWAAAENTGTAVINALLQAGAVVNARDRYGWLPIHTAADRNPNPDIIDALLKAGADPDKRAYFVLFRPIFLLKHNANMSDKEKEVALAMLKEPK
jgi:ankyrin repeat protein